MKEKISMKEIKYSLRECIPVIPGYIFLGIAFGLMLQDVGYHFLWAFAISFFVYAGSMQMVMVSLLGQGAGLLYTALMTFLINGRHIFYGLSFIDRYKDMGAKYPYMIFSLTDETYSVLCSVSVPDEYDKNRVMFQISLFNQCFWILGSVIGSLAGQFILFDFTGIDFSMTALFVVITLEQVKAAKNRLPVMIGMLSSIAFLILLGADNFMLPSLCVTVIMLLAGRKKIEAISYS